VSTTHDYTEAEMDPIASADEARDRAKVAGYTNPEVSQQFDGSSLTYTVTVDEDAVVKATLLSDMKGASLPSLSLSVSSLDVQADGSSTGNVTITGPANATVKLDWDGLLPVAQSQVSLDGGGSGTATFGPVGSDWRTSKKIEVRFDLDDETAPQQVLDLTFTPA